MKRIYKTVTSLADTEDAALLNGTYVAAVLALSGDIAQTEARIIKRDARQVTSLGGMTRYVVRVLFEGPASAFKPNVRSDQVGRDGDWR